MKSSYLWAVWLWVLQVVTGGLLVIYIVVHTLDNAMILKSQRAFEDMLSYWHNTIPHWFYILMVLGLAGVFVLHMLNGIRIASKPYKEVDVSWRHGWMLKHVGTTFWFTQVLTGSVVAIAASWHFIVQHAGEQTVAAAQSTDRLSPIVFLVYFVFLAAVMFHSLNGIRAVFLKLGMGTDKTKDAIVIGFLTLMFLIFFGLGIASMGVFLARHNAQTASPLQTSSTEPGRASTAPNEPHRLAPGDANSPPIFQEGR